MKRWLCLFSLIPALFPALAAAAPGDDKVLAAREAFRLGERIKLGAQYDQMAGARPALQHDLAPWVEYWFLRQRLDDNNSEGVADFLQRQNGSYLAEKLRGDWLKWLGKRQKWEDFEREATALVQPDTELSCYVLQGRIARPGSTTEETQSAIEAASPLWLNVLELPDACTPLMDRLVVDGRISLNDVWLRMRRQLEQKKFAAARRSAEYLPEAQRPDARLLESITDKPLRYLDNSAGSASSSRLAREMTLYAMQRLARNDPVAAAAQWQQLHNRFSATERSHVWGQIAMQAAQRHLPEALGWYAQATDTRLSEEQLAWQARAALRAHDWPMVRRTIGQMPAQMAAQPDWVYWLARALTAHNRADEAQALYQKISGQPNFYSNLADEELNRAILIPPRALPPTKEEVAEARDNPGLRRALALYRLDMRMEGLREWNWALRGMNDRQLLAAADLARRNEIFDRAIYTADRTQGQHDYTLRYLAPFRDNVMPQAREMLLDSGWVYGLMRQESRFIMNAKSGVGAKGLMQLMPKTAQWVAKKIGLRNYHPNQIEELGTNITLGTNYLRMVLSDLDQHPVLASAAYNAGPGRARRWRAEAPLEGAIYAETIPFAETRDYVKKVMSNAVYYSALFEDKPQSLKLRLGTVGPRQENGAGRIDDLP